VQYTTKFRAFLSDACHSAAKSRIDRLHYIEAAVGTLRYKPFSKLIVVDVKVLDLVMIEEFGGTTVTYSSVRELQKSMHASRALIGD
jgi:hypothetical protein